MEANLSILAVAELSKLLSKDESFTGDYNGLKTQERKRLYYESKYAHEIASIPKDEIIKLHKVATYKRYKVDENGQTYEEPDYIMKATTRAMQERNCELATKYLQFATSRVNVPDELSVPYVFAQRFDKLCPSDLLTFYECRFGIPDGVETPTGYGANLAQFLIEELGADSSKVLKLLRESQKKNVTDENEI